MKIILSIKPEFVEKIFDGSKLFEFRRTMFKNKDITTVILYASAPISKVVGEFEIENIIHENIEDLWEETKENAGISKEYYTKYFNDKTFGYAFKIKTFKRYSIYKNIQSEYGMRAPQSFAYLR